MTPLTKTINSFLAAIPHCSFRHNSCEVTKPTLILSDESFIGIWKHLSSEWCMPLFPTRWEQTQSFEFEVIVAYKANLTLHRETLSLKTERALRLKIEMSRISTLYSFSHWYINLTGYYYRIFKGEENITWQIFQLPGLT